MLIILMIVLVLLIILAAAGYYLMRQALYPQTVPYIKSYALEVENGRLDEAAYLAWEKEDVAIQSPAGYRLRGTYFPLPGAQRTIILVHGISYTRLGMMKYMPMFRRRGYNVLMYDQRYHGMSGGRNTSFGFHEKFDLKAAVDWALQRLGPGGLVATMGESLGAATCLQHAAIDPRLAFVIADAAYADLYDELALRLRVDYHLPGFPLLPAAGLFFRLDAGFYISQVNPARDVAQMELPVFFVHGQQDAYIPMEHSQRLYQAKAHGLRRLYLAPNADHVESYWTDPEEYDRQVGEFLDQVFEPAAVSTAG